MNVIDVDGDNIIIITTTIIIQFNSILYYLCAESTAARPITDRAQVRYK
jgi:predicted CDP-diglyceride synthetase/phosphatidate cytidylyltransferase